MRECFRDFVTLNRPVSVTAVRKYFLYACRILLEYLDWEFTVVDSPHPSVDELALQRCLILLDCLVGQLDSLVVLSVNFVPNKALDVLARAFD